MLLKVALVVDSVIYTAFVSLEACKYSIGLAVVTIYLGKKPWGARV